MKFYTLSHPPAASCPGDSLQGVAAAPGAVQRSAGVSLSLRNMAGVKSCFCNRR